MLSWTVVGRRARVETVFADANVLGVLLHFCDVLRAGKEVEESVLQS